MSSSTEICNMALYHLGASQRIQNLETDKGQAATSCRTFYEIARDEVFEDFAWPFARTREFLALVEESPTDDWGYAYQYPANASNLIKIPSGTRNETKSSMIAYEVAYGDSGKLIYTDQSEAEIIYTKKITDTARYSAKFIMALSYKLAGYIAASVTGGDPFKLKAQADANYQIAIMQARANALNEERSEPLPESEFITGRE